MSQNPPKTPESLKRHFSDPLVSPILPSESPQNLTDSALE